MSALPVRLRLLAGLGLALVAVVALSGCVSEVQDGDKVIFTNTWWAPSFIMLLGIVAGLAGMAMLQGSEGSGGIAIPLLFCCPVGLLVGLSLMTDRCEVDPAGFQGRMNFSSSAFAAQYDDIERIEMVTKRSHRYSSFVQVIYNTRDGKRHEFSLSHQMAQTVGRQILSNARDHGIPASDNRSLLPSVRRESGRR